MLAPRMFESEFLMEVVIEHGVPITHQQGRKGVQTIQGGLQFALGVARVLPWMCREGERCHPSGSQLHGNFRSRPQVGSSAVEPCDDVFCAIANTHAIAQSKLSIVCQAETAERRPIRTELRIADHEAGDWTSGDISGRDPFGDEAAGRRSTFVAELAGHQELGLRAYSDVISERSGGRIS